MNPILEQAKREVEAEYETRHEKYRAEMEAEKAKEAALFGEILALLGFDVQPDSDEIMVDDIRIRLVRGIKTANRSALNFELVVSAAGVRQPDDANDYDIYYEWRGCSKAVEFDGWLEPGDAKKLREVRYKMATALDDVRQAYEVEEPRYLAWLDRHNATKGVPYTPPPSVVLEWWDISTASDRTAACSRVAEMLGKGYVVAYESTSIDAGEYDGIPYTSIFYTVRFELKTARREDY